MPVCLDIQTSCHANPLFLVNTICSTSSVTTPWKTKNAQLVNGNVHLLGKILSVFKLLKILVLHWYSMDKI